VLNEIPRSRRRLGGERTGARTWPIDRLSHPEGMDRPAYIDAKKTTGSWRAHQVPLRQCPRTLRKNLQVLDGLDGLLPGRRTVRRGRQARPEDRPTWRRRANYGMSDNPPHNGGLLLRTCGLPDFPGLQRGRPQSREDTSPKPHGCGVNATDVCGSTPKLPDLVPTRPRPTVCRRCST